MGWLSREGKIVDVGEREFLLEAQTVLSEQCLGAEAGGGWMQWVRSGWSGGAFLVASTVPVTQEARPWAESAVAEALKGWGAGRAWCGWSSRRWRAARGPGGGQWSALVHRSAAAPPHFGFLANPCSLASPCCSDKISFLSNPCGQFSRQMRFNLKFSFPLYEGNFPFSPTDFSFWCERGFRKAGSGRRPA